MFNCFISYFVSFNNTSIESWPNDGCLVVTCWCIQLSRKRHEHSLFLFLSIFLCLLVCKILPVRTVYMNMNIQRDNKRWVNQLQLVPSHCDEFKAPNEVVHHFFFSLSRVQSVCVSRGVYSMRAFNFFSAMLKTFLNHSNEKCERRKMKKIPFLFSFKKRFIKVKPIRYAYDSFFLLRIRLLVHCVHCVFVVDVIIVVFVV